MVLLRRNDMTNLLSKYITHILLKNSLIKVEEIQIYQFGVQLYMLKIIHILAMLMIAILLKSLTTGAVFILVYTALRKYAGGYHANSNKLCLLMSMTVIVTALILSSILSFIPQHFLHITLFLLSLLIIILAPVDNKNKPLDSEEVSQYKKELIKTVIVVDVFYLVLRFLYLKQICLIIIVAYVIEVNMLILGIVYNKYSKDY